MTSNIVQAEAFERRAFLMMSVAAAAWGITGCAGRQKKKSEPANATEGLAKAFKQIKKRIRKHVADESKHAPLEALLDDAQKHFVQANTLVGDWRYALVELPPEKKRDRDALVSVTGEYNEKIKREVMDAYRNAVEARQHVTDAEWAVVFPGPEAKGA